MTRTPEEIRAEAVNALMAPGADRIAAVAKVAEANEKLRPLVQAAVAAGVPQPRIMEITGLARNTIRDWAPRA